MVATHPRTNHTVLGTLVILHTGTSGSNLACTIGLVQMCYFMVFLGVGSVCLLHLGYHPPPHPVRHPGGPGQRPDGRRGPHVRQRDASHLLAVRLHLLRPPPLLPPPPPPPPAVARPTPPTPSGMAGGFGLFYAVFRIRLDPDSNCQTGFGSGIRDPDPECEIELQKSTFSTNFE